MNQQKMIEQAIAAVQNKGLEVTVSRVKSHLMAPVPMAYLIQAVAEMRHQHFQLENDAVPVSLAVDPAPCEDLHQIVHSLQQRVAWLETELARFKNNTVSREE